MDFLLQTTEILDAAKEISPGEKIVYGLLTVLGYVYGEVQRRLYKEERQENKEQTKSSLELMTKVELHLAAQETKMLILADTKNTVKQNFTLLGEVRQEIKNLQAEIRGNKNTD